MSITKYISADFEVGESFDSPIKTANYQPECYVPPDMEAAIQGLQPDGKFAYVHLLAMTDGDHYGPNLNGDIFPADGLTEKQSEMEAMKNPGDMAGVQVPRYKTFEQAKFFRHHDNSPSSPFYGDVVHASWNDVMKRVELLCRIARQAIPELGMEGAPDIVMRLDSRGYITVSMGCKITVEKCSYCGHEHPFVSQRCDHLKNQMGQIMPNGVKVAAINYGMRFFDISDVSVPADPVAYSLMKVASIEQYILKEANVAFDDKGDRPAWMRKRAEIYKEIPASQSIMDNNPYDPDCDCKHDVRDMAEDAMKKAMAAAHGDIEAVLATTAASGVVLSPYELAYFTQLSEGSAKVASNQFNGFERVSLDKFSTPVYDALSEAIGDRSGFVAGCPAAMWEQGKIAAKGGDVAAEYYGFYRACLAALPRSTFMKAAHRIPQIRDLHGGDPDKLESAVYHLAHAGLGPPN